MFDLRNYLPGKFHSCAACGNMNDPAELMGERMSPEQIRSVLH
jgi:hypothetical protein